MFAFFVLGLALVAAVIWSAVGVHAPLLGRMPGRWLQNRVRQPRLGGTGAVLTLISWSLHSPSLLAVGIGLVALGHTVKTMP